MELTLKCETDKNTSNICTTSDKGSALRRLTQKTEKGNAEVVGYWWWQVSINILNRVTTEGFSDKMTFAQKPIIMKE